MPDAEWAMICNFDDDDDDDDDDDAHAGTDHSTQMMSARMHHVAREAFFAAPNSHLIQIDVSYREN